MSHIFKGLSLARIVSLQAKSSRLYAPLIAIRGTQSLAKPGLLLSDSCVKRLRDICQGDEAEFLRITVKGIDEIVMSS